MGLNSGNLIGDMRQRIIDAARAVRGHFTDAPETAAAPATTAPFLPRRTQPLDYSAPPTMLMTKRYTCRCRAS